MEGLRDSKLKIMSTMGERELKSLEKVREEKWGRRLLKREDKIWPLGPFSWGCTGEAGLAGLARPSWPAGQQRLPGHAPAMLGRSFPPFFFVSFLFFFCLENVRHRKCNIFHIRTPFSIILDSLKSSQRALQDYAGKHHSPTIYYNNQWGKVKPLSCKPEPSYLLQMKFERGETNFVGKSMIVAILGNIWKQLRDKLSTHVCVDNFSRTNRQYF